MQEIQQRSKTEHNEERTDAKMEGRKLKPVSSHHFASDNVIVVEFEERTAYITTRTMPLLLRSEQLRVSVGTRFRLRLRVFVRDGTRFTHSMPAQ